ncbi:hypothetical protein [Tolypothrix sp. VBCCA 56010]|uniref:hypothetical protein n=1 Tax=Tolypothrix sp. VBCCA 56010 TaxID=3137731 RepID=UPI003D7DD52E
MSESKFLTIQLSPEDRDRLQTEAIRLNVPPETLAQTLLHNSLAQVNPFIHPREALLRLREIARKMPPVDAVKLARESRQELEQRGIF